MERKVFLYAPIDAEKMEAELKKRGLSKAQAGVGIGASKGFIGNCTARGAIQKVYLPALEKEYNIRYEDIKPDEPDPEPEEQKIPLDMPTAVFRGIMRTAPDEAVYRGVKKALLELLPDFEEAAYRAMNRVLNE